MIDPGAAVGRREDPLHDLVRLELGSLTLGGVPRPQDGLRVDADEADPVDGRADDRADRGAVLAADARGLLGIQRFGVGSSGVVRVRDVDPGIDERHGLAGGRAA